jgi:hypothetical protein
MIHFYFHPNPNPAPWNLEAKRSRSSIPRPYSSTWRKRPVNRIVRDPASPLPEHHDARDFDTPADAGG